jgi:hypothetical protein
MPRNGAARYIAFTPRGRTLIGWSPPTVRQRYVPAGLPFIRLALSGKLIFYRNQLTSWLLPKSEHNHVRPQSLFHFRRITDGSEFGGNTVKIVLNGSVRR